MKRWLQRLTVFLGIMAALIVAFYLEENWRGAREWARVSAELKAKGYPLTVSDIIPPPVPDADNVAAAPVFAELFAADGQENKEARLIKTKIPEYTQDLFPNLKTGKLGDLRLYFEDEKSPLTEKEAAQKILAELDKEWTPLMLEVEEALQRPRCRWPLAYEKGFAMPIPSVTASLNVDKVLQLRALAYLELNQPELAVQDLRTALKLARVYQESLKTECLWLALGHQNLAVKIFYSGSVKGQWRQEDYERLQQDFALPLMMTECAEMLKVERAQIIGCDLNYDNLMEITNPRGREYGAKKDLLFATLIFLRPHGWENLDKSYYARHMQEFIDVVNAETNRADVKRLKDFEPKFLAEVCNNLIDCLKYTLRFRAGMSASYVRKTTETLAKCNQAVIACAVERYRLANGAVPDTLTVLVPKYLDQLPAQVVNGEPFIYRKVSVSDYILYSVGWNLRDDGGKWAMQQDKGDWVWASKPELYQELK